MISYLLDFVTVYMGLVRKIIPMLGHFSMKIPQGSFALPSNLKLNNESTKVVSTVTVEES